MMINSPNSPTSPTFPRGVRTHKATWNPLPRANESKATQVYHHPSGASLEHITWMQCYLCPRAQLCALWYLRYLSREIAQSKSILPSSNTLRRNLDCL